MRIEKTAFAPILALPFLASCTLLVNTTLPEQTVVTDVLTIQRSGGEVGDITFAFGLPREHYQGVQWAFSYYSFDAPVLSAAIRRDTDANPYVELLVDDDGLTRIEHGFLAETTEGVLPLFAAHDQGFPESYGAEMESYLSSTAEIPTDDPRVAGIASRIRTDSMIETVYNAIAFFDSLEYDWFFFDMRGSAGDTEGTYRGERTLRRNALSVLDHHAGVCWDKAPLAAAILRACSIPARTVYSPGHEWNEVYLPRDGWVPVDFSNPDRQNRFTFPIQPWRIQDYAVVTAVGGSGVSRMLRDWDRELRCRLLYHPPVSGLDDGASITEAFADRDAFFAGLRHIVVRPLEDKHTATEETHFMDFFDAETRCLVYRQAEDCILEMADGTSFVVDTAAPMTIPVDGVPAQFRFRSVDGFILIERT